MSFQAFQARRAEPWFGFSGFRGEAEPSEPCHGWVGSAGSRWGHCSNSAAGAQLWGAGGVCRAARGGPAVPGHEMHGSLHAGAFPSLSQAFSIPERFWKALDGPVLDLLPDKVIKCGKTPFFPEEAALIQLSLERQRSFGKRLLGMFAGNGVNEHPHPAPHTPARPPQPRIPPPLAPLPRRAFKSSLFPSAAQRGVKAGSCQVVNEIIKIPAFLPPSRSSRR